MLHNLCLGAVDPSNDLHWKHSELSLDISSLVHNGFQVWMLIEDHLEGGHYRNRQGKHI